MTDETLLFRQINSSYIRKHPVDKTEEVLVGAFMPRVKRNESNISVNDGDRISAETALQNFNQLPGCKSKGVLGVTVGECTDLQLTPRDAPTNGNETHVEIDFPQNEQEQWENIAEDLWRFALQRTWLYRPE